MYKLISNRHQSDFWSPRFWVTRSSRKKAKKKQSGTSTSKSLKLIASQWCCSHGRLKYKLDTPLKKKKKKEIKKHYSVRWSPEEHWKRYHQRTDSQLQPHCDFPSARWFCDKYKLISLEWIISVHVHLHLNFNQLQQVPWACSAHMIINTALRRERIQWKELGGLNVPFKNRFW